jgi:hypothetical protein
MELLVVHGEREILATLDAVKGTIGLIQVFFSLLVSLVNV